MYPYLFAEHNRKQQRQQLARRAEQHRLATANRPTPPSPAKPRRRIMVRLRRRIRPSLATAR